MANYSELHQTINDQIKANGNQQITGPVLNAVLQAMVSVLGKGYQFMGVAKPDTNPGTPDGREFYIALQEGVYVNFNGYELKFGVISFFLVSGDDINTNLNYVLPVSMVNISEILPTSGIDGSNKYTLDLAVSAISNYMHLSQITGGLRMLFRDENDRYVTYEYLGDANNSAQFSSPVYWFLSSAMDLVVNIDYLSFNRNVFLELNPLIKKGEKFFNVDAGTIYTKVDDEENLAAAQWQVISCRDNMIVQFNGQLYRYNNAEKKLVLLDEQGSQKCFYIMHNGLWYDLKETDYLENDYMQTGLLYFPANTKAINILMPFSTMGSTGIAFVGFDGRIISATAYTHNPSIDYTDTLPAYKTIRVPQDCAFAIYSYYTDSYCDNVGYPKFSGFEVREFYKNVYDNVSIPGVGVQAYFSEQTGSIRNYTSHPDKSLKDLRLSDLYAIYDDLVAKYPDTILRGPDLGDSTLGGEPIRQYIICNQNPWIVRGEGQLVEINGINLWDNTYTYNLVMINAGTHGDEKVASYGTALAIKDLVESTAAWANYIKSNFTIRLCPCINPYGFENFIRTNGNNADLNRDTNDFEQPETQAWKNWIDANADKALCYIDTHNVDFYTPFFEFTNDDENVQAKYFASMAAKFAFMFKDNWNTYFRILQKAPYLYAVISTYAGTFGDYVLKKGILSTIIESPADISQNRYDRESTPGVVKMMPYSTGLKIAKELLINSIIYMGTVK